MKFNYKKWVLFLCLTQLSCYACTKAQTSIKNNKPIDTAGSITIPIGGNAWVNKNSAALITDTGLMNWAGANDTASVYIRTEAAGTLQVNLRLLVPQGKSEIGVSVNNSVFKKSVSNQAYAVVNFGKVIVNHAGYVRIFLKGIERTGDIYARVSDVILKGDALSKVAVYVKNNEGSYFYWGRRGPSVHLSYKLPAAIQNNVEWFYNEVTVPVGNDVQGSYFMSNGFAEGYFGMQVNSPTERHVLFSIWSPYSTNDPNSIPDSLKIKLLKKGPNVKTGEFGNEGSGGLSYMIYPWKAGKTYCFLTHAEPNAANNTTVFTCYFKAATDKAWQLIASFQRPKTNDHLTQLYSFLENFDPDFGNVSRKGNFGNGWLVDTGGKWYAVNSAVFSGDATANINYRKDYSGGVENNLFYLRNCGFFNDFTKLNITLQLQPDGSAHPAIDFTKLP